MKEFLTRTLSALFLIALIVGLTLLPPLAFIFSLALILSVAGWEMGKLLGGSGLFPWLGAFNLFALILGLFFHSPLEISTCIVALAGFMLLFTTRRENLGQFSSNISSALIPPLFLAFPLFHLYLIWERGISFLYFLIILISIADTAAYLFGTRFGKHKIFPTASPKKSWEGFLAALVFAELTGIAGGIILNFSYGWLVGLLTALAGQVSDPMESLFKRAAGVKDSSHLIPGHGGVLDRIDSYILAAPVFYYLIHWLSL